MDFDLKERALFQANNDLHTLAGSRTGMYAYSVWLFAVPLVVTVDLTAEWDSTEIWLADNMFELAMFSVRKGAFACKCSLRCLPRGFHSDHIFSS